tara:strand:- start:364 stop:591 length:228 start_codon:yes stop_codon:yes gene_type:complete
MCDNITEIINNVNENCQYENLIEIKETCPVICLTSLLFLYNNCMDFMLQNIELKEQLNQIITWCYFRKVETESGH